MSEFLHYSAWISTLIQWYWRWKKESMPLNWIMVSAGALIAFVFTKPNLVWLGVTAGVYVVCGILHYLHDTGPRFWEFGWYIYTVGFGYFLCAVPALLFRLPVYNLF